MYDRSGLVLVDRWNVYESPPPARGHWLAAQIVSQLAWTPDLIGGTVRRVEADFTRHCAGRKAQGVAPVAGTLGATLEVAGEGAGGPTRAKHQGEEGRPARNSLPLTFGRPVGPSRSRRCARSSLARRKLALTEALVGVGLHRGLQREVGRDEVPIE